MSPQWSPDRARGTYPAATRPPSGPRSEDRADDVAGRTLACLVDGDDAVLALDAGLLAIERHFALNRHADVHPVAAALPLAALDPVGRDLAALQGLLPVEEDPVLALANELEGSDLGRRLHHGERAG